MQISIGSVIEMASILVTVVLAVWKITNTSNKNKQEIKNDISSLRLSINTIEIETKHVREDHDKVVSLGVKVDKNQHDINGLGATLRETKDHVSSWGQEISKLTRGR